MHPSMRKLIMIVLLLALLALPVGGAWAQEETPETEAVPTEVVTEETTAAPQNLPGLDTLMFLLGAAAIVVAGGAILARDNFREEGETAS